jgi:hypothetical protein
VPATPIGSVGRITHASDAAEVGSFVEVVDDTSGSTGGAFIFGWTSDGQGWDAWVEHVDEVDAFVKESGWAVEWFEVVPEEAAGGRPRRP